MSSKTFNIRARFQKREVFRTPPETYLPLFEYVEREGHDWFQGVGFDPSAGDGRMIAELKMRGNDGPHFLRDIRNEELEAMALVVGDNASVGDYLTLENPPKADFMLTNPPFTLATRFVEKARQHISGPIILLNSLSFQTTQARSEWLKESGLAYVLNIPKRPKWEVQIGGKVPNNVQDFAFFVFLPDHDEKPVMDWLDAMPQTEPLFTTTTAYSVPITYPFEVALRLFRRIIRWDQS